MIYREAESELELLSKNFKAIAVIGPRQYERSSRNKSIEGLSSLVTLQR
ncbi:hypothetical protein SAMN04487988_105174 [Algoriphagus hitonicola]|uniref:Uncharacterized protein n=1 Tax=Algoriphagus hitonicola TaxID=435880 RepID=A0A1I2T2A5_9BACT|nr:hypothetical protein SAMN04487988_105174 [Algoriphagus hitonicola]